jgi:hypothetical protein
VNKKPKLSLLRQLRLPPPRLRLRRVPLQRKRPLQQLNRRRKHLLSHPRNKLPGSFFWESSADLRWKTSFVKTSRLDRRRQLRSCSCERAIRAGKICIPNGDGRFTLLPKSASPDASLRIRACETRWRHATRQTPDFKCDAGREFLACGIHYFGPARRRGRSQSCSTPFAGNRSPAPARAAARRLVRHYCQTRSRYCKLYHVAR